MDLEKIKDSYGDILIVEDELINSKFLSEILEKESYQTRHALDAQIALRVIEAKTPDLIIMAINLPDISGIELTKKLKEEERTKNIPIIFVSSFNETILKIEALEAGGIDYITKPFQARELTERIKIHLKMSRMQIELSKYKNNLEELVKERTEKLEKQNEELEHFNELFVDREFRIKELRDRVKELEGE